MSYEEYLKTPLSAEVLYRGSRGNKNQAKVVDVALETVGGIENSILDGEWEGKTPTALEMVEIVWADVRDQCPREVRFLGNEEIGVLVDDAVRTFEFPFDTLINDEDEGSK